MKNNLSNNYETVSLDDIVIKRATGINKEYLAARMSEEIDIPYEVALSEVSSMNLDESIVALYKGDESNIVGFLGFSNRNIASYTPITQYDVSLSNYLSSFKQLNGTVFFIAPPFRGIGLDKRMLVANTEYLQEHDFIWCGVDLDYDTFAYWERMGFKKLFSADGAVFYIYALDDELYDDLFEHGFYVLGEDACERKVNCVRCPIFGECDTLGAFDRTIFDNFFDELFPII